ncbi:OPT family oligopeptide transporter [Massiliimalia massiliensis]|uniref:OPT family oligopeptide transporter n=1 Tax=Massiliimalia massiliensis TaxID=1852384 RepID=UPI000984B576|nr:oligopeptide transporter, OPT family [Massiliimalia massiliensis]
MEKNQTFKPFVPADKIMPEFTATSIIVGILLAVLFGGANAYLGLKVGMTISASIPAAVISMGIIRVIMRRDSILENNMVQTIGSAGESLAAGAIFTLPALFMWANNGDIDMPSFIEIALIALCGGILGVLFMVPLRKALIVEEHGTLPYPEGSACAEVLVAGEEGGEKSKIVFSGLGIAALYKFITDGVKLFPSEVNWDISAYKGSAFGLDVLPALAGVGYICGKKIASYMLAGGVVAWFVLMPLIALFGGDVIIYPADVTVNELIAKDGGVSNLWGTFIRYIGAGAVATGGIISLIKSFPLIVRTFAKAMKGLKKSSHTEVVERTDQDMSMKILLAGIVVVALAMWLLPFIPVNLMGALIVIVFGFFFATVSSRMVGLIGSSNNPVSGMAIATMLIATILLKVTGNTGTGGMVAAIAIGSIICIIAAMAGDTSQDLKTGFLVGATPRKQQYGEIIGAIVSAAAIGGILYLLNAAWEFGSAELAAPQATLMKMVTEGVMNGNLPWTLVFVGVGIAIVVEILGIPVLPFAVGLYLPIHLSVPIMAGALVRVFLEKRKKWSDDKRKKAVDNGVLYCSGMIAGEGLVGILLAVFAVITFKDGRSLGDMINISGSFSLGNIGGLVFFAALLVTIYLFAVKRDKKER